MLRLAIKLMMSVRLARNYLPIVVMASLLSLTFASFSFLRAEQPRPKATVLLIPFKVNSLAGAPELAAQVNKSLNAELSKKEGIVILDQDTSGLAEPTDLEMQKLARETKAAFLIYGSVTALEDNFSLDVRLLNGVQGELSAPLFVLAQGKEELAKGIEKLVGQLTGQIASTWAEMPEAKIAVFYGEGGPKEVAAGEKAAPRKPVVPPAKAPVPKDEPAPVSEVKVGLLPFKVNAFQNSSASATEVWEALARELALGGQVAIVGKEMTLDLLKDPAKVDHSEERVKNFARAAQADYIVYGTINQLGQSLSIDSRVFHNLPDSPFTVSKIYVEGSGPEAFSAKVRELAFELKRNILKGKIIVTPLPAEPVAATKGPKEEKRESRTEERGSPSPAVSGKVAEPKVVPSAAEAKAVPPEPAKPAERQDLSKSLKKSDSPISITARTLEADNRKGTVTFKGQVVAKKDDYTMTADVMVASYETGTREIKEITASGRVKITQADRVAVAQRAIFYNEEQKVVLTQDAKVWQGKNEVSGEVITVFLQEDRMIVEGGEKAPVSAIIFPAEEEKK